VELLININLQKILTNFIQWDIITPIYNNNINNDKGKPTESWGRKA